MRGFLMQVVGQRPVGCCSTRGISHGPSDVCPNLLDLVEEFRRAGQLEPVRLANAANNNVALLREAVKAAHKKETDYRLAAVDAKDRADQAEKWLNGDRPRVTRTQDKDEFTFQSALDAAREERNRIQRATELRFAGLTGRERGKELSKYDGTEFDALSRATNQLIAERELVYRQKRDTSRDECRKQTGLADVWKANTAGLTTAVGLVLDRPQLAPASRATTPDRMPRTPAPAPVS